MRFQEPLVPCEETKLSERGKRGQEDWMTSASNKKNGQLEVDIGAKLGCRTRE